jgi:hypothetical protein
MAPASTDHLLSGGTMRHRGALFSVVLAVIAKATFAPALVAYAASPLQRLRPVELGSSASPLGVDYATTLGFLLRSGRKTFILGSWIGLTDSGSLPPGTLVLQPAEVDGGRPSDAVAHLFSRELPTRTDGALLEVVQDLFHRDGSILGIGVPALPPIEPSFGLPVAKSGRTTGVTCGVVSTVNVTVLVRSASREIQLFDNVFVVEADRGRFAEAGDNGAPVVAARTGQPVGIVLASLEGASGTHSVLVTNLSAALSSVSNLVGAPLSLVGGGGVSPASCWGENDERPSVAQIPAEAAEKLAADRSQMVATSLANCPGCGVEGVGIGIADEHETFGLVVYVSDPETLRRLPAASPNGFPVRGVLIDPLVAR